MKQRFSSLDVKVIAHELNESLVTLRLSNIYDLSSKILLLKFAKPDNKKQLLIDTGFRCHLTDFARTTAAAPSAFVARLRKYLKTRRLTGVTQVGTDRVLEFQFSDGQYRLFLEFYASGNLILTDTDLKILAISRNVSEGESQEQQRIGLQYTLSNRQNYLGIPPLTRDRVKDALTSAVNKAAQNPAAPRKGKAKVGADLRKSLAHAITEVPPVLVDHTLQANNFDLSKPLADILASESLLDELMKSLTEARDLVESITASAQCKGYIFAKYRTPPSADAPEEEDSSRRENLLYEDFHPFCPQKFEQDPSIKVLEFDGFNQTVDEFYSSLEGQRLESRLTERETQAKRRLEHAKQEQTKRIEGLQEVQAVNMRKAAAIEANVERVQEAMDAVNGLIAQGMDWVNIGKLIEREKKRQNPVADVIKLPLKLEENTITLTLAEEEFEDEEEEDPFETDSEDDEQDAPEPKAGSKAASNALNIDISLSLSPWSNAREYYDQRKSAVVKEEKTQLQASKALKNTEQRIQEDLKKGLKQEKALLQPIRKQMWFEKFMWFVSSDGYLVIGGKDAHQYEMLYKKHLRKGDVYCHADLRGASVVIIKNNPNTPDAPIPPATLTQAGTLSVCSSEAWDSKAGMGAWWVNAENVSKSSPTGEFLPLGNFAVQGKKNFLPPAQLLMGLGFMFRISDDSKARHVKHRVEDDISQDRSVEKDADEEEEEVADPDSLSSNEPKQDADGEESDADQEDADDEDQEKRDNPLQQSQPEDDEQNVSQTEQDLSNLKVSEDPAANDEDLAEENDDEATESVADTEFTSQPATDVADSTRSSTPNPAGQKGPKKRGQKGKAKKIAAKYKDQDEDDRAAAEAVLGASLGKKKAEAEAKAKADRQAELEAAKERRRAQHQKQQKATAEHEEARRAMMDDGIDTLDDQEEETTTSLDTLVGTPLAGDDIAEIVPVCAPWTAMGKFKYKVKLQPGAMKKGKAVKEILEKLKIDSGKKNVVDEHARDTERMWPRELELIKGLKAEEIVNSVPVGKVRVMMSGGTGGGGGGGKGSGGGKSNRGGRGGGKGGKK